MNHKSHRNVFDGFYIALSSGHAIVTTRVITEVLIYLRVQIKKISCMLIL
jgi:hypothetical protein